MTEVRQPGGWRLAKASVIGTAHIAANLPLQDHAEIGEQMGSDGNTILILAVADGAGSAVRADEGAREACLSFLQFTKARIADPGTACHLPEDFAAQALATLREDLSEKAQDQGAVLADYACTLLGAVIGPDVSVFCQIGDGAIAFRTVTDPAWRLAAIPQRGEFVNETTFVTSAEAMRQIQSLRVSEPVIEFAMMTDGVEAFAIRQATRLPHLPFMDHVLAGIRRDEPLGFSEPWSNWLKGFLDDEAVAAKTDDDKTLVLGTWAS